MPRFISQKCRCCGKLFVGKRSLKYCSDACRTNTAKLRNAEYERRVKRPPHLYRKKKLRTDGQYELALDMPRTDAYEQSSSAGERQMITPFLHTFPKTPVSPAYEALAAQHGFNTYPVAVFEGRQCYVFSSIRILGGLGRGRRSFHNRVQVKFLDSEEIHTVPAGEWAKKAKNP